MYSKRGDAPKEIAGSKDCMEGPGGAQHPCRAIQARCLSLRPRKAIANLFPNRRCSCTRHPYPQQWGNAEPSSTDVIGRARRCLRSARRRGTRVCRVIQRLTSARPWTHLMSGNGMLLRQARSTWGMLISDAVYTLQYGHNRTLSNAALMRFRTTGPAAQPHRESSVSVPHTR
jgi:hypothetical protein